MGGGIPHDGELVLSLHRMAEIGEVEALDGQITVGAGATLGSVQRAVAARGFAVGVDLAARDTATIGGMVATNAGGLHVLRHGPMRHQVVGHEAVLGTGDTIRHLAGLVKDNTGYDLGGLLCGSEGTLGVVTAVRLRLVTPPAQRVVALCAFADSAEAVAATSAWRRSVPGLEALELFSRSCLELVVERAGGFDPFPVPHRWYVLVEVVGRRRSDPVAGGCGRWGRGVRDAVVATDAGRAAGLWRLREEQTTAIASLGVTHKLDVTLPLAAFAEFLDRVPRATSRPVLPMRAHGSSATSATATSTST